MVSAPEPTAMVIQDAGQWGPTPSMSQMVPPMAVMSGSQQYLGPSLSRSLSRQLMAPRQSPSSASRQYIKARQSLSTASSRYGGLRGSASNASAQFRQF